jgi:hypothetical protein
VSYHLLPFCYHGSTTQLPTTLPLYKRGRCGSGIAERGGSLRVSRSPAPSVSRADTATTTTAPSALRFRHSLQERSIRFPAEQARRLRSAPSFLIASTATSYERSTRVAAQPGNASVPILPRSSAGKRSCVTGALPSPGSDTVAEHRATHGTVPSHPV